MTGFTEQLRLPMRIIWRLYHRTFIRKTIFLIIIIAVPPPLRYKQIRAKSPNSFCYSYELFALHCDAVSQISLLNMLSKNESDCPEQATLVHNLPKNPLISSIIFCTSSSFNSKNIGSLTKQSANRSQHGRSGISPS